MLLSPNKRGFVKNSVSTLSVLAFITAFSSFVAIEFLYNRNTKNQSTVRDTRTAYIKELETLPVEPGQGSAYFTLISSNSILNQETSLSVKLLNDNNTSINAFGLAVFVPSDLELTTKPDSTLISNGVINYVEYISITGGTQINIFAAAKPNATLTSASSVSILDLKFIPKKSGDFNIKFTKQVPQYPEIMDISSQSLLDITVLKDITVQVVKATARQPVITPSDTRFYNTAEITINSPDIGTSVKYTTDGTNPTTSPTAILVNTFPYKFFIDSNLKGKVIAYAFGDLYLDSPLVTNNYAFDVSPIKNSSTSSTNLSSPVTETLTTDTPGSKIYYTLNDIHPSDTSARILYSTPIIINHNLTLKAIAVKPGYYDSVTFTKNYTFNTPEVIYTGLGYCISRIECEFGINDINDTKLTLRYDAKDPSNIPSKLDFIITDSSGNTKLAITNITPVTGIFTVNVPNYKNYFDLNNPNYIEIKIYNSEGVYTSYDYVPKMNTLPVIDSYSPTSLDTYSKVSFKVSASDGGGVIENSDISYVELLRQNANSAGYTSIKKVSTQPGPQNIVDYVIEDTTLNVPGNYIYAIKVYDNLGLTRYSEDIPVRFFEKGDVNKDFKLDVPNDLFPIIKAIFSSLTPDLESMDLNLDSKIDPLDIIKLLKKLFI